MKEQVQQIRKKDMNANAGVSYSVSVSIKLRKLLLGTGSRSPALFEENNPQENPRLKLKKTKQKTNKQMALISWSVDFLKKLFEISPPSCLCNPTTCSCKHFDDCYWTKLRYWGNQVIRIFSFDEFPGALIDATPQANMEGKTPQLLIRILWVS